MNVIPLASSSKGNAYLVEHEGCVILIDDGLSYRELCKRLKEKTASYCGKVGLTCFPTCSCEMIQAVLITHSHGDHVDGLSTLLKKHDIPVYANMMTAETIIADKGIAEDSFVCFENGQDFEIGPFVIHPFSIPHDTSDPVGYLVKVGSRSEELGRMECSSYFHGTDIGTPLDSIGLQLHEADIATLESNHDPVMLKTSGRAACLVQRIAGPRGHLANWEAAELVKKFASPRLKKLMLAHLSQDCNTPRFAEETMREALAEIHRSDIELEILAP